jgi:hypothetical protein
MLTHADEEKNWGLDKEGMQKSVDQVVYIDIYIYIHMGYIYVCVCVYVYIYIHMGYIHICMYVFMWARADGINPKGLVVMYSDV